MKKVYINPQVYDDIKVIKKHIEKDSTTQAEKVVKKIFEDIESLAEMPERGANLSNKVKQKTKYKYILTLKHYAIMYYISGDAAYVTLVLHTARDISALKLLEPK